MALDGSCMDVADEAANAKFFGYPRLARPKRLPAGARSGLVECGTHAVVAAGIAPYGHSEQVMAAQLLPAKLTPEMLVLADRNFYGFKLWQTACATGAKLAWRVKSNLKLPVEQMLPDGSYLSRVFDSDDRARRAGQTVRVIDYALEGSATPAQGSYRLLTNLGPRCGAGLELAALYHERWEIEGCSMSSRRICAPTARCCAARRPSWCSRSCGAAAGALCDSPVDGAGGLGARTRSGSPELHARRARDQAQDAASCGRFPERLPAARGPAGRDRARALREQSWAPEPARRQAQDEQLQCSASRRSAPFAASASAGASYLNSISTRRHPELPPEHRRKSTRTLIADPTPSTT